MDQCETNTDCLFMKRLFYGNLNKLPLYDEQWEHIICNIFENCSQKTKELLASGEYRNEDFEKYSHQEIVQKFGEKLAKLIRKNYENYQKRNNDYLNLIPDYLDV